MRVLIPTAILLVFAPGLAQAQIVGEPLNDRTPEVRPADSTYFNRLARPYRAQEVSPVNFQNSMRIFDLMRAGQLYLSLADAIALALENNLDIELERYLPQIARTDVGRAEGGGLLRGLSLLVNEPPPGIGGPNGPLLTTLTASSTPAPAVNTNLSDVALITQQQNDLSVTGALPQSSGPAIPQYDPAISGLVNVAHQSTPEYNPLLTGTSNWIVFR